MSSIPRHLQKINFSEHDAKNIVLSEDGLQGSPKIDNMLPRVPHESTSPIKIIWPNGEMRQIVGVFQSKFLSTLNGGKIIVETDQNGVPNERSGSILSSYLTELAQNSTIAPLHIPRWDNDMFKPKQQEMIKLIEKICLKNSKCAKQQKNSHTTGRKGHARLLTEMEAEKNGKVNKIELWDRAHKRKDDNNDSDNNNTIMDTTHDELSKENLDDKGSFSSKDDSGVSKSLPAKRTKLRGFYHDKYWSHVKELLPQKCTRVKEVYANSSSPQEDGVTKEAHMEIHVKEHQDCVRHEKVTKQQPCLENYNKDSFANSSLGRHRIIAMKANNENSTKANQGSDVPSFPHNQPTNKDKSKVFLFLANPRNRNKVVAIGSLGVKTKYLWLEETCLEMNFMQFLLKNLRRLRMKNCLDHIKIFKLSEMLWIMLSLGLGSM